MSSGSPSDWNEWSYVGVGGGGVYDLLWAGTHTGLDDSCHLAGQVRGTVGGWARVSHDHGDQNLVFMFRKSCGEGCRDSLHDLLRGYKGCAVLKRVMNARCHETSLITAAVEAEQLRKMK